MAHTWALLVSGGVGGSYRGPCWLLITEVEKKAFEESSPACRSDRKAVLYMSTR